MWRRQLAPKSGRGRLDHVSWAWTLLGDHTDNGHSAGAGALHQLVSTHKLNRYRLSGTGGIHQHTYRFHRLADIYV